MSAPAARALAVAIGIHLLRFAVIVGSLELAAAAGVRGWYLGLAANAACCVLAVLLMTYYRLWRSSGMLTAWRGRLPAVVLVALALEALVWAVPGGIEVRPPGVGLWALTLLLVGVNEELISRGVVLARLRAAFDTVPAVVLTAVLFGAQHFSHLVTGDRAVLDIATNVALSGVYGFALAAFQVRFAWLWPLVLVHATSDFTSVLGTEAPTSWYVVAHAGLLALGVVLLGTRPRAPGGRARAGGGVLRPGAPG